MFRNYLYTALRNLRKNKLFSFINIAGLTTGMAACLLILQYVSFEMSYDRFHHHAADIYRVVNDRYQEGKLVQHGTITYSAIGRAMKDDFPEVVENTRVKPASLIAGYGDKKIGEQRCLAVDNSFLSMFSFPLLAGDVRTALREPYTVVLSEKLARRLFSAEADLTSLVGKAIRLDRDSAAYNITGICKDIPEHSHLQFDLLLSYVTLYSQGRTWKEADHGFKQSDFWHYIQLKPGTDYKTLEAKLPAFSQRHFQGSKVSGSEERFYLQPLLKAHLHSDFEYEIGKIGSATVVWGLLIIAVLIIVIAWVNYVNLSTAKSMERAREVGVRKVAGATRQQLMVQFLTESFLLNMLSLLLAIGLVLLLQDSFNRLVQHQLSLAYLFGRGLYQFSITIPLVLLLVTGILGAGCYPAFVLSMFRPIQVLKGRFVTSGKGIALRKALVVAQFAVTVVLIAGSFVVYRQLKYVNRQNLGMNLSQMLIVKPPVLTGWDSTYITRARTFKNEVKQLPHVKGAAAIARPAGVEMARAFDVHRTDVNTGHKVALRNIGADEDFVDVYGVKVLAGRNFAVTDYNPDWNKLHNVLLNEAAVKLLGFSSNQDAIGKSIMMFNKQWDIVGVVNDYHQKSLHYAIEPMVLQPYYGTDHPFSIKVDAADVASTIGAVRAKYAELFPGNLFEYFFLDQQFNAQYNDDRLFGKVFGLFAGFAIFIACLGLLGLSLFATAQRNREIGVRKVMGASVLNIVLLLSGDFIRLVLIAFIIATPVAWYIMHNWLQDFAYRIDLSWWIFVLTGLLVSVIALATISSQAVRAALVNPVKSLRTE